MICTVHLVGEKRAHFYLKNYFIHRNVTSNVKQSFNYGEECLEFCTDGYILLAALKCMDRNELTGRPANFPEEKEDKLCYLQRIATQIIDMVYTSSQDTVKTILNMQEENLPDEYPFCICKQVIPGSTMVFVLI